MPPSNVPARYYHFRFSFTKQNRRLIQLKLILFCSKMLDSIPRDIFERENYPYPGYNIWLPSTMQRCMTFVVTRFLHYQLECGHSNTQIISRFSGLQLHGVSNWRLSRWGGIQFFSKGVIKGLLSKHSECDKKKQCCRWTLSGGFGTSVFRALCESRAEITWQPSMVGEKVRAILA